MNICFVVLHYKATEETIACIESILALESSDDVKIIVVDNGSDDGSGEHIKVLYHANEKVTVLIQKIGNGFSKGNNIGYIYAKEKFSPDFLICTNNDTLFVQKDFIHKIKVIFKKTQFDVLGPDVYVPKQKEHQSPIKTNIPSIQDIKREIEEHKYLRKHMVKYEMQERLYPIIRILKRKNGKKKIEETMENVVVSGACLIFSNEYIDFYSKAFEPEVGFYFEETILLLKCIKDKKKVVYCPDIQVIHNHRVSTKKKRNFIKKRKFIHDNMIMSGEKLIEFMEGINLCDK